MIGIIILIQILQHVWLFINFETNLMILAQLPMLRVLVGQVCALNKIWLQLLRHMAEAQRNHFGMLVQKLVSNESLYVKYSQNSK